MINRLSQFTKLIFIFLILLFGHGLSYASFNKHLWPQWQVNNPLSQAHISHREWQQFLNRNLSTNKEQINVINYKNLTPYDIALLEKYVEHMAAISIDHYNRNEQLAYWINLYNALTVQILAKYYPVMSIQEINISPGLFSIGPWGANIITIQHISLSLDDINNKIIRPIWNDSRTHYALNNATMGAPNLSNTVYEGTLINQQLDNAAIAYINSLRGAQVIEGKLILSKIYDWYEEDFGGTKEYILYHITQYAQTTLLNQLQHVNSIDSYTFNWHINSIVIE